MKIMQAPSGVPRRLAIAAVAKETKQSSDNAAVSLVAMFLQDKRLSEPHVITWNDLEQPKTFDDLQPADVLTPTYDLIAYCSIRVAQSYQNEESLLKLVSESKGEHFQYFDEHTDAAFAYTRGDVAVLCFRGTILTSARQWFETNFRIRQVYTPARHAGFEQAWQRLRIPVETWLTQHKPKSLILTGHSLGGCSGGSGCL